jgi:hypothetical protein
MQELAFPMIPLNSLVMRHHSRINSLIHVACVVAGLALAMPCRSQTAEDLVQALRNVIDGDRTSLIAANMVFTTPEAKAFWPLYKAYREEVDDVGEEVMKLANEYASAYPNGFTDASANKMLAEYTRLEQKLLDVKAKHRKKIGKALPPQKLLRLTQIEARLDLKFRAQLASRIPLTPETVRQR